MNIRIHDLMSISVHAYINVSVSVFVFVSVSVRVCVYMLQMRRYNILTAYSDKPYAQASMCMHCTPFLRFSLSINYK